MSDSTAPLTNHQALPKRVEWRFFLAWLMPFGAIAQAWIAPEYAVLWVLTTWCGIAAIDHFVPGANTSPEPIATNAAHRWVVRMHVPLQFVLIGLAGWQAHQASWPGALGLAVMAGWVSGAQGITFAHELGHSRNTIDRALGWALMTSVWYAHFMVEHYRGHHPRAATTDDPATSRRGESVYAFLPRTVSGCWRSAWALEGERLAHAKQSWFCSPLAWVFVVNVLFVIVFIAFGAIKIVFFWALMSAVAFTLLELVNYIEHYGLQRNTRVANGKTIREPFNPMHAWNANHLATNTILVNLQRHSDHHTRAWKPFSTLEHSPPPCPQLPTGYAGCLLLALVPALWFKVMDARLDELKLA